MLLTVLFCVVQPIYLNFKLRHGAGNADETDGVPSALATKKLLKKVISINGEEVDTSDMDQVNIHDYAQFAQEEHITSKFFSTIRRKTFPDGTKPPLKEQLSFQFVAREILRAESVLAALKHYSHRSDSESEIETSELETEEEDLTDNRPKRKKSTTKEAGQRKESAGTSSPSLPSANQQSALQTNNNDVLKSQIPETNTSESAPPPSAANDQKRGVVTPHDVALSMPNGKESKPETSASTTRRHSGMRTALKHSCCPCRCVLM